jgi:hypothetical protein
MNSIPNRERVIELLFYDQETGSFTNKVTGKRLCENSKRYAFIRVDGKSYLAHRLAWLIVTGDWPISHIDHADLDQKNNAFSNLREATRSQNLSNCRVKSHNRLGIKGVRRDRHRFKAQITVNRKNNYLGSFGTAEEAQAAYLAAAKRAVGEFARTK